MTLYNATESLVRFAFSEHFLQKGVLACQCEQCQDDVLAYALNHLPCRYVSTNLGSAYVKAQYMNPQLQSDVLRELTIGSDIVRKRPRHVTATSNA